jgi:uncharacterized phage infection (PIP) family protein YhgE
LQTKHRSIKQLESKLNAYQEERSRLAMSLQIKKEQTLHNQESINRLSDDNKQLEMQLKHCKTELLKQVKDKNRSNDLSIKQLQL